MRKVLITLCLLLLGTLLPAETFFTLRGIDRVYPVVEIGGTKVPKEEKTYIRKAIDTMTKELGIGTDGYSQRSLALLVGENYAVNPPLIQVRLVIGEQVHRLDSQEKVFAMTYQNAAAFAYDPETVEEKLEDSVDELLEKFADQYREERGALKRIDGDGDDIAAMLGYETDYATALAKAKAQRKNVMLVLVSNFCPWCRKFEEQVLRKDEVNAAVHARYVPVILNKEKDAFPPELNLSFTPIVHFIDPATQKSYHQIVGYNEREAFLNWLRTDSGQ